MRIAVNTRMLRKDKMEGIGYFTLETFQRITRAHPEHEFFFLFDRPYHQDFIFSNNIQPLVLSPAARHPVLWILWYEWSLPRQLAAIEADYFIGPDGFLPLRSAVPGLAVIHDINFEHYPGDLPFFNRTYYRYFFPRYAQQAGRIATVSEFSKNDISSQYKIDPSKIDVVYNGASENFIPLSPQEQQAVRNHVSGGLPYFLFISSLHKRKNIANLLSAFDRFKKETSSPLLLLLAGSKRWWTADMEEAYSGMEHKDQVRFLGRVPDQELYRITAAAFALTYVSTFEGFGIPLVEAFRCHVPVLTSNLSSMPEIAGNAALQVDPFSIEAIANGMKRLYKEDGLREILIRNAEERAHHFSWDQTAEKLWNSFIKMTESKSVL